MAIAPTLADAAHVLQYAQERLHRGLREELGEPESMVRVRRSRIFEIFLLDGEFDPVLRELSTRYGTLPHEQTCNERLRGRCSMIAATLA